ncbi:MAG: hypothetical protein ACR2PG_12470 [Hyphomicrobiaceae bacterium]
MSSQLKPLYRTRFRLIAIALLASTTGGTASDYQHTCWSADGQFTMNDNTLQTAENVRRGVVTLIPYRVREKAVLEERRGYCLAEDHRGSREKRYNYAFSKYVLKIEFRLDGHVVETTLLCEMASSGLPAAFSCAREVETLNWSMAAQAPPSIDKGMHSPDVQKPGVRGGTLWFHEGSVVRITADGMRRRITFERPHTKLTGRGASPGKILFEGRRNGNRYNGTAYVFTKSCGKFGYDVLGIVKKGETQLQLEGRAPRLDSTCNLLGYRSSKLEFRLLR